jgi:hypothetical protein
MKVKKFEFAERFRRPSINGWAVQCDHTGVADDLCLNHSSFPFVILTEAQRSGGISSGNTNVHRRDEIPHCIRDESEKI